MYQFDPRHCDFDADGLPLIRFHTCDNCKHTMKPQRQYHFPDPDEGPPEGVVALSNCPVCERNIMSATGMPEFMEFLMEGLIVESGLLSPESVYSFRAELSPISATLRGAH